PIYPVAVIVPILAFPATILCIPPMIWHFTQRNIAAGSLMLWMIFLNFPNAINPLIWPRDNLNDWWDGQGFCDIQARLQVGAVIALQSCTGVVARRLANVMDTGNITVAPSRNHRIRERCIEVVFCWVLPVLLMIIYYIVQPMRYYLYGISGCVAAYDPSWPSIVLVYMWAPIAAFAASYYTGLLVYRLYRYRREFHRLLAARNTTKSRFIRLFIMSIIFLVVVVPYDIFILYQLVSLTSVDYQWSRVHGDNWNSVAKVPSHGTLRFDRWAEMAFGYILFFLFGTGTDANNSYKRMLVSIGLGNFFPSLYNIKDSTSNTPSRVSFIKGWPASWSTKAKGVFSKTGTVDGTLMSGTHNSSSVAGTPK
ncbi:STE3-domain-containing protein, partial [Periconia macrospinosa]